ncbi:MAG: hypothetical protein A2664_02630 [Candidatus Taylorbacteria bacterium RIFCSPHIGHO2_01_FULL_46_22b]|uniref:Uncharacterized protein n=1 Tax=Candidatus Taylorbacteria bacterium RIFCSPHIGHO2_01_FULL_46_22b TaxID=1802301 RepID=A0A1G2M5I8_9BACT|nr:MAG: hypothetical protein A2664_02630 [Candidatus Taylorbacteria bacterium RIFCSPHIGHO2_01_FULL_46_22b]
MEKLKVRIEESLDKVSLLENIAYYILLATAFLLPIFFIPSSSFQFQFSKVVFVSFAVLISCVLWLIARLKDGRYLLPNNLVFLLSGVVLVITLLATLFSPSIHTSFIGQGSEVGTWASLVVLFAVLFMFSALFRPKERVFYLYLALFASCFLIVGFHALRFAFGASFLSFGIFTDITSNLIGKWNDLGIFFGLVTLLSLMTIELVQLSKAFRTLLWVVLVLSIISLSIVNFPTLWYSLAFFSLLYFVYAYAYKKDFSVPSQNTDSLVPSSVESVRVWKKVKKGSVVAAVLIVISIVFLIDYYTPNRNLGTWVSKQFQVSNLEVRPNVSSTVAVGKSVLKSDPVFGVGPNRFVNEWLKNKPDGVNQSVFWNTDFASGIGLLPTQLVTTGILGFLSWILLMLSIMYLGVRYLLTPMNDKLGRYLSVSSFFASLFLWSFFVFYIPSTVILVLTFLFTGVFVASLYNERLLKPKTVSFGDEPKVGFVSVLVLTVLLIGVATLTFAFGQKFLSSIFFQKALIALNVSGDITLAEKHSRRALAISSSDLYDRLLVEINLNKLNTLLSSTAADVSAETVRTEFQSLMGETLQYARNAVDFDRTDYQNWISLGRVYEAVVPLKIEGAYDNAKSAYGEALTLNPRSPEMHLMQARLEIANGDQKKAREEITAALALKQNYTEAIFLLSQIQMDAGQTREAIASVESAAVLAPNDPTVFFQLGLLKYNNRDYRGAVEELERSVLLAPTYSNAKYFLGLSYDKLGREEDALTQFNDIKVLNPNNTEVPIIIENIKAGRDPFASINTSERPDQRDTLPVEETPITP